MADPGLEDGGTGEEAAARADASSDVSPEVVPADDAATIDRRAALKKAAIGAGVAVGAWTAPRIEGLSLVPDYAEAATIMGTFMITVTQIDCSPNILQNANCWGACAPGGNNCVSAVRNFVVAGETIRVTATGRADQNGDGNMTVDYSLMDPPFNMCTANAASGVPGPGTFGQDIAANGPGMSFNMVAIDQSPTNQGTSVTFTIVCT